MELIGKITTKNDDLNYGFVNVPKLGDIFFSKDTKFSNTSFNDLQIGQKVQITATETPRGLFATNFQLAPERASLNEKTLN